MRYSSSRGLRKPLDSRGFPATPYPRRPSRRDEAPSVIDEDMLLFELLEPRS